MEQSESEREPRVTPLELFFDLVFVFAITQVTSLLASEATWGGLLRGMLVLGALWWAWAGYAWLTNTMDPDEGAVRLAMLGVMGAGLVVSLAVPEAFGKHGVLFGAAYLVVRASHLVLYAIAARGDRDLLGAIRRLVPTATMGPGLLLVAGFLDGAPQVALWGIALAIDFLGVLVGRARGWRVSPHHFVERHGLIVIIAIGESIVAIGVGARGQALDAGEIVAALLGIVVAAAIWWAYFDWVSIVAESRLAAATGPTRAALARDVYAYLHLLMVAGIVLFALGMKRTLADVGDPLGTIPALGFCGGVILYLLAHVGLRLRIGGGLGHGRPTAVVVLAVILPLAATMPAIGALALVAAVCTALIAYEVIRYREPRSQVRLTRQAPA